MPCSNHQEESWPQVTGADAFVGGVAGAWVAGGGKVACAGVEVDLVAYAFGDHEDASSFLDHPKWWSLWNDCVCIMLTCYIQQRANDQFKHAIVVSHTNCTLNREHWLTIYTNMEAQSYTVYTKCVT